MKNIAKVIFKPEIETECSWSLSNNTVMEIKRLWNKLENNTLELIDYKDFGYKGIKVECDSNLDFYITHNNIIKKEDFISSVKKDQHGKIENLLLRSMPDSVLCFVKPYVFADIVYRKAK
jgi:hypothetical protein